MPLTLGRLELFALCSVYFLRAGLTSFVYSLLLRFLVNLEHRRRHRHKQQHKHQQTGLQDLLGWDNPDLTLFDLHGYGREGTLCRNQRCFLTPPPTRTSSLTCRGI